MRAIVLVVAAGCGFEGPPVGAGSRDAAAVDGRDLDARSGQTCLGSGNFRICVPTPMQPVAYAMAGNEMVSTDLGADPSMPCTPSDNAAVCVVAGTTIAIGSHTLFGIGRRPLVLFATGAITITGNLDVGSHQNGPAMGAGYDSSDCGLFLDAAGGDNGGGGGAGGTFGSIGGSGGNGGSGNGGGPNQMMVTMPDALRGGCAGGEGGLGTAGALGGSGNHGGGAVLILSGERIQVTGYINASGGGGNGGHAGKAGGGGGGSGGMIALDAGTVTVFGELVANGGAGGGGADNSVGSAGGDPPPTLPLLQAAGGTSGGGAATPGAAGATSLAPAGSSTTASQGAGGAGGGVGAIRILSGQIVGGICSPAATT